MSAASDPGGFAVYAHWPFCRSKCPYCDFNSHVRDTIDQARWADALVSELRALAARVPHRRARSLFFGGGTPSLMAPETAERLIETVDRLFGFDDAPEITLEANPTSVEATTFPDFIKAGVNRLSLGVQALDDAALRFLGREHDVAMALGALDRALATGARVSFDLIYARPGQDAEAWDRELDRALSFGAGHMSLYQLTIEPGTGFAKAAAQGRLTLPDADTAADLFERTQRRMEAAGLPAYEVSNHAIPGQEARHNLVYWRGGAYVGIGPGAHGRVDLDGRRHATVCRRAPEDWLRAVEAEGHALLEVDPLSDASQADEYLLMGLRLSEGIDLARYEALAGRRPDMDHLIAEGLLRLADGRLAATARGRLVLNSLIAALA